MVNIRFDGHEKDIKKIIEVLENTKFISFTSPSRFYKNRGYDTGRIYINKVEIVEHGENEKGVVEVMLENDLSISQINEFAKNLKGVK